ncbi:MAG: hypothetical protein RQ757_07115 [Pseudomonadales bacterium]|nr:hypothetical protein [Pseudomonadales bacterium]
MSKTPHLVAIPGPLHPDLFDGQTPIMQLVPLDSQLKVYRLHYTVTETTNEEEEVIATSGKAAREQLLEACAWNPAAEVDVYQTLELERRPTHIEVQDYMAMADQRRGV